MRVAAIHDIHANLPALEAVLQDIRRADMDQVVVGGDVVPGPMPRETIECLLDLDIRVQFIQGNGEVDVLAEWQALRQAGCQNSFEKSYVGRRCNRGPNTNNCYQTGHQHAASRFAG